MKPPSKTRNMLNKYKTVCQNVNAGQIQDKATYIERKLRK